MDDDDALRHKRACCVGDQACYRRQTRYGLDSAATASSCHPQYPEASRVAWHGQHFREQVFAQQIPLRMADIDRNDLRVDQLALLTLVAGHIGIELEKEWSISEAYLQKKTRVEMLAMGNELEIFNAPQTGTYLAQTLGKKAGGGRNC